MVALELVRKALFHSQKTLFATAFAQHRMAESLRKEEVLPPSEARAK